MNSKGLLILLVLAWGVVPATRSISQENQALSLPDVQVGIPTAAIVPADPLPPPNTIPERIAIPGPDTDLLFRDLVAAGIVKDPTALIRLGKALFWDMQAGSDGVQACATCHFSAGADNRSKNQISPGLHDTNFHGVFISGDNDFGNSTVPYTANDPHTPNPPGQSEPPSSKLNVPGLPYFRPNHQLEPADFPLNGWLRPTDHTPRGPHVSFLEEFANASRDTNDVISSQGVRHTIFQHVNLGKAVDTGAPEKDIFNLATPGQVNTRKLVRRVEPRNAPTVINAVYNFDNFWDGRASFIFNGVNPFGFRDRLSTLKLIDEKGVLIDVYLRVTHSSLASQAVGPATSNFEMSFENRTFSDLGKKLLSLRPLAKQFVHPDDSVLGSLSRARPGPGGRLSGSPGLNLTTYTDMVHAAFKESWWNSSEVVERERDVNHQAASTNNPRTMVRILGRIHSMLSHVPSYEKLGQDQFTQAQWNFSMFWGLAIQAYEATLIADDTPYDRFEGSHKRKPDPNALTPGQRNGLTIFTDADPNRGGRCNNCHSLPVTTNHSVVDIVQGNVNRSDFQGRPFDIIETMAMGDGGTANYDKGFYNIGVRRSSEDIGREDTAPRSTQKDPQPEFENPRNDHEPFPLSYVALGHLAVQNKLPPDVLRFVQLDPKTHQPVPVLDRQGTHGNFKAPSLRNVKFTGPYFHNGDSATLRQVVEFYTRGGNFPNTNFRDLDPDIEGIPGLRFPEFVPTAEQNIRDLVDFISNGLADQRVAMEQAPFDHPQLFVPNGTQDLTPGEDTLLEIPAAGQGGRGKSIDTFLDLDPQDPITPSGPPTR